MNRSETIGSLAAALSLAQGQIKPAPKDSANSHTGKSYADLTSVWEVARDPLTANGLAVIQTFAPAEPGQITIETTLAHSSGEWVSSLLTMPAIANKGQQDAQAYGSAITYARRYSLAAILGIAPAGEDNDGEGMATAKARPAANGTQAQAPDTLLDAEVWDGPGQCPRCHAPEGKRHGKQCLGGQNAQAAGR